METYKTLAMQKQNLIFVILMIMLFSCNESSIPEEVNATSPTIVKIAFGSCANQDLPQPMLNVAVEKQADVFVYLGDNIYGDSHIMDTLIAKYGRLAAKAEFQKLRDVATIYSVWDDHDFGENDAGRHYPFKAESKEIFMDFWQVSADSDRRKHEGIYGVEYLKRDSLTIQFVLLDTRTFRDELIHRSPEDSIFHKNDYIPNQNPDSTFLGEAQWTWLEKTLKEKADVRIIASSNQFSHEYNGWESWTNVPHQQKKMIDLIASTKANGVVFISGDVHWGEISKLQTDQNYPIYDVTSSGITQEWDIIEPNKNRVGEAIPQNNIGWIEIAKEANGTSILLSIIDSTTQQVVAHKVNLKEISFQ